MQKVKADVNSKLYVINLHNGKIHRVGERRYDILVVDEKTREINYVAGSLENTPYTTKDRYDVLVSVNGKLESKEGEIYDKHYEKYVRKYLDKIKEEESLSSKKNYIGREALRYLNGMIGTRFKFTADVARLTSARVEEGFTLDDFMRVINIKVKDWYSTEYRKYLRPKTLFGTNFQSYLNQSLSEGEDPFLEKWKQF